MTWTDLTDCEEELSTETVTVVTEWRGYLAVEQWIGCWTIYAWISFLECFLVFSFFIVSVQLSHLPNNSKYQENEDNWKVWQRQYGTAGFHVRQQSVAALVLLQADSVKSPLEHHFKVGGKKKITQNKICIYFRSRKFLKKLEVWD